jgi:hypothetical protein
MKKTILAILLALSLSAQADTQLLNVMHDLNIVVYEKDQHQFWIDTVTGCHFGLPNNRPVYNFGVQKCTGEISTLKQLELALTDWR